MNKKLESKKLISLNKWDKIFSLLMLIVAMSLGYVLYNYYQTKKELVEAQKLALEESILIKDSYRILNNGIDSAENKDLDSAIFCYKSAIGIYPKNGEAYHFLGYAEYLKYTQRKKADQTLLSQAIKDIEMALSLNQRNTMAHYNYAIVLWAAGMHEEAISQLKILLELDPSFKNRIQHDGQFKPFKISKDYMNLIWK